MVKQTKVLDSWNPRGGQNQALPSPCAGAHKSVYIHKREEKGSLLAYSYNGRPLKKPHS